MPDPIDTEDLRYPEWETDRDRLLLVAAAELGALRAALAPFANARTDNRYLDVWGVQATAGAKRIRGVTIADFRAARAALGGSEQEEET